MPELTTYNLSVFNKNFLRFRIKYYFKETGEAILRHKLLMVFIFCLLAPGFNKIYLIGVPFSVIVDPSIPLRVKLVSLTALLSLLFLLIRAQANSIKGGEFGDYLAALNTFSPHVKKIDFIVLLLSLNVIWVALIFGAAELNHITNNIFLLNSYYLLYISMVIAIIVFIFNVLYINISGVIFSTLLCMLIALISTQQSCLFNFSVALFSGLFSIVNTHSIIKHKQKIQSVKPNQKYFKKSIASHPIKLYFLTQIVTVRAHKAAFIIRTSIAVFLSIATINLLLSSTELVENMFVVLLVLIGIQTYILSTLNTFFSKNEQYYSLFHFIFHDNFLIKRGVEIICIITGLTLSLFPLMIFLLFTKPAGAMLLASIISASTLTIIINRMLYMYSLRFCFFTSLINTVANIVMQYFLIGAFLGK